MDITQLEMEEKIDVIKLHKMAFIYNVRVVDNENVR